LVLISTWFHAYWNYLTKRATHPGAFVLLLLWAAALLAGPLTVWGLMVGGFPWQGWACVLAAGTLYALYFASLAYAYRWGDLSIVYPLSRGIAPVLTLLGAVVFLRERPTVAGVLGVLAIGGGAWGLHLPDWSRTAFLPALRRMGERGSLFALLTGTLTAVYSVVDGYGVRFVPPPAYVALSYGWAALFSLLFLPWRTMGAALREEWRHHWREVVGAGFLSPAAYLLVLYAMRLAPVGYVVPLRSLSILFSVFVGVERLREGGRGPKWVAALLMVVGMGLIALWG
jgi:drug/metabolite transporter (DMT)-like permease